LERAKEAMVDVAQFINEVKRDSDMLQLMRDIQVNLFYHNEHSKHTIIPAHLN